MYYLLVYVPLYINVSHILIFKSEINNASIMTIFDTNMQESIEFLKHFSSISLMFNSAVFWITSTVIYYFCRNISVELRKLKKYLIMIFVLSYSIFCFGEQKYKFPFEKLAWTYIEHKIENFNNKKLLSSRSDFRFKEVRSNIPKEIPETYVVVIGESVNKTHMSLYGSDLKTTPNFDRIKDELSVFKNVNSSYCYTLKALNGTLCFDEKFNHGDIITFFKQAGFKTFWFSNQYVVGFDDNLIAMVGSLADSKKFINKSYCVSFSSPGYDEKLLEYFNEAILDKSPKKIIFVHLMGSHYTYSKRYPSNFDVFKPKNSGKKAVGVAHYDNSILYTDYLLDIMLNKLKSLQTNAYLLYFSDHGEDVTDDPKSPHSHIETLATPPMFDIPLVVWLSEKYKELNGEFISKWNLEKPYKTKNMIHSIINISRLESLEYNKNNSIFEK